MLFPSYLSTFRAPSHHNAYRRVLADEKIDFATDRSAEDVATRAALLFLPKRGQPLTSILSNEPGRWPIRLRLHGDILAEAQLHATLDGIAAGTGPYRTLGSKAEKGRAVLTAIADAIFPALQTGNVARTEMARAAALEIAVAIANRNNLTIGMRSALGAVNGRENDVGCKLGLPSQWGIEIHAKAGQGRVSICESTAWDHYCFTPDAGAQTKSAGKRPAASSAQAGNAADQACDASNLARHVAWQDGNVLIADVCTTFSVKTGEWWLTRKLLPHKSQRATVGAKIEMVHFQSPDKTLHRALSYENGTVRHVACNWLAFLCRFMRGICTSKASKNDYVRELLPRRAARGELPDALGESADSEYLEARKHDANYTVPKAAELVDDDARRVGRRSGTWSDEGRYHGKVDLNLSFQANAPAKPMTQNVDLVGPSKRSSAYSIFSAPAASGSAGSGGSAEPSPSKAVPSAPEIVPMD